MPLIARSANTNDLSGALVLGHSLRDEATTKKLAVLVTSDGVSEEAVEELRVSWSNPSRE